MKEIDEEEYFKTLERLAKKKWASVKGSGINQFVKMSKTRNFLLQKGFEPEIINKTLSGFSKK
jgi:regulatory protein